MMQQTWWDRHAIEQIELFTHWIGDHTAPSKVAARQYVISQGYKSILDCGCGTCSEYYGYKQDAPELAYFGVDSCLDLVALASKKGIPNVVYGDLESLPFADNFADVVYIRHVLEHLEGYESALKDAIRVASREVLVNWFIRCTDEDDLLNYDPVLDLRHNRYNRLKLETFLSSQSEVEGFCWSECGNPDEELLHIKLKV